MKWQERHAAERAKSVKRDAKTKEDQSFGVSGLKKLKTKKVLDMAKAMPMPGASKLTDPSKPIFTPHPERQGFRTPGSRK